jgi:hypothetical protein
VTSKVVRGLSLCITALMVVFLIPSCTFFTELIHPISGTWSGTVSMGGQMFSLRMDLDRDSSTRVSGTLLSFSPVGYAGYNLIAPGPITGTMDGDNLTLTYTGSVDGSILTATLTGNVNGDSMNGTILFSGGGSGGGSYGGTFNLNKS